MNKLYISLENDCYINQAIEYKLFKKCEEDSLFFWVNSDCVVIGENQNVYNEVDIDYAKNKKIAITRRISGGGSVFHDLGNLNYTYYTSVFDEKLIKLILKALNHFKINAKFSGRNDLCVENKKISGLAYFCENNFYLLHGCLMFDVDKEKLSRVLKPKSINLQTDAVKSNIQKVTNLNQYQDLKIKDFISFFKKDHEVIFLDKRYVTSEEIAFFKSKQRIFSNKENYKINFSYKQANIFCDVKNNIITKIKIFHDFLDYKFNLNSFLNKKFDKEEIENYLEIEVFSKRKKR